MENKILFYILIVAIIIIEAIAIYFIERGKNNNLYAVLGISLYTIVGILFLQILKRGPLGIGNSLWQAGAIIIISLISVFILKEKMKPLEWFGFILAIISVITISFA
jgi:multidrug transporter EmrE-like cation transporter